MRDSKFVVPFFQSHTRAVNHAFTTLFDRGLIYRKEAIVNWCPSLGSAISDIEVDHLELERTTAVSVPGHDRPIEFGVMHNIAYKLLGFLNL